MQLAIIAVDRLTPAVRTITLAAPDGSLLPGYDAGAHITLAVPMPGGATAMRAYSLVSDPADLRAYTIAVKRSVNGRGGSAWLHDAAHPGTTLEVGLPVNAFGLRGDAAHHVFIAGGIGITPLLGLATAAQRAGLSYALHYAAQDAQSMAFRAAVAALPGARTYFSQDGPAARMDIRAILGGSVGRPGVHVYACGPARLIDAVRRCAADLGYPARQVHVENFGPAWTAGDAPVRLLLSESAIALTVAPGVTLLDAMEDAGAWIPSDCRRGECGACVTGYTGGTPLHRDSCLTPAQRAHSFCPCVSWAAPDRVLTLPV